MHLPQPLVSGTLVNRYKRFLADVRLNDGHVVTAHTPNTGSMLGCSTPGMRVWLSRANNSKRKYPWTWELTEVDSGLLVGIHTGRSNGLVWEAVEAGIVPELAGYRPLRREVAVANARLDMLLENDAGRACYVEVKNVTAVDKEGRAIFPDAVSTRAGRHLKELAALVAGGHRAVIFFCVQRGDARGLAPADAIDPVYGQTLRQVLAQGVEALAWRAMVGLEQIVLQRAMPVELPEP